MEPGGCNRWQAVGNAAGPNRAETVPRRRPPDWRYWWPKSGPKRRPAPRGRDGHVLHANRRRTCRAVAAYRRLPPCAAGKPALFRLSAIMRNVSPRWTDARPRRENAHCYTRSQPGRKPRMLVGIGVVCPAASSSRSASRSTCRSPLGQREQLLMHRRRAAAALQRPDLIDVDGRNSACISSHDIALTAATLVGPRFSAAAAASDGLTVAGWALALAAAVVVGSIIGSVTPRRADALRPRFFGIRPCRRLSASTGPSSYVWWEQNSEPATTVRPQGWPFRRSAPQRGYAGIPNGR